jgi:hypothetical protein
MAILQAKSPTLRTTRGWPASTIGTDDSWPRILRRTREQVGPDLFSILPVLDEFPHARRLEPLGRVIPGLSAFAGGES